VLPQHWLAELQGCRCWSPQLGPVQMQVVVSQPAPRAEQAEQSQGGPASTIPVQRPLPSSWPEQQ
jgi:hypothetical protein